MADNNCMKKQTRSSYSMREGDRGKKSHSNQERMKIALVQQLYNSCFPFLLKMKPSLKAYLGLTFFSPPQTKIEQLFSWKIHKN